MSVIYFPPICLTVESLDSEKPLLNFIYKNWMNIDLDLVGECLALFYNKKRIKCSIHWVYGLLNQSLSHGKHSAESRQVAALLGCMKCDALGTWNWQWAPMTKCRTSVARYQNGFARINEWSSCNQFTVRLCSGADLLGDHGNSPPPHMLIY